MAVLLPIGLPTTLAAAPVPDAYLDVRAAIPHPDTADIPNLTRGLARLNIYRTEQEPRAGILVRIAGFGSSGVNTGKSNVLELPGGQDNPDFAYAREDLGFDIYLLEWYQGTTFIQKNAMVLVELLRLIREGGIEGENDGAGMEAPLGVDEKLVLIPESMGGLVSRYALAYLEHQGIDHRVDLWMTIDSPHAGAYIPVGIQYMVDFLNGLSLGIAGQAELAEINSPAARQMLLYHHTQADNRTTPNHDPMFDQFWNELNNVYGGYPQAPGLWRVALSNGRDDGKHATFVGTDEVAVSLPKTEPRLVTFRLTDETVNTSLEAFRIRNPLTDDTVFKVTVPVYIGIGTFLDIWSLRPHLDNGEVFRSRTGLILRVGGRTIDLSNDAVRSAIKAYLEVPDWIPDGWVTTALNATVSAIVEAASDVATGVLTSIRVDADYAWEYVPGGLNDKTQTAGNSVDVWGTSVRVISPKHCFIPATSSLGVTGYPLQPLRNRTAQDTPFDAIHYEPAAPGNRTHVQYNENNGEPAFRFELNRILTVPSMSSLSPPRLPEGSYEKEITVRGINFTPDTVVHWNGGERATSFVSPKELRFTLSFFDLQDHGTGIVTLADPAHELAGRQELAFEIMDVAFRVTPPDPAPGEPIHLNYSGLWNDGGTPVNPWVTVDGTNIQLQAATPTGNFVFVISPYELDVELPGLTGGTYRVTYDGYPDAETKTFNVYNPAPVIQDVDPPEIRTGTREVPLQLQGAGFLRDPAAPSNTLSQVTWNGTPVPATILSADLLVVDIGPDLVGDRRTHELAVINPGPGGGTETVDILYTAPILASAELTDRSPGDDALQVRLTGEGLEEGSTVWWDGVPLATEQAGDGTVVALVPGERTADPGAGSVTVVDASGRSSVLRRVEFLPPTSVRYVKPGTPDGDDGASWTTAYDELQTALHAATAGQEIWVAEGVYLPSIRADRSVHFTLPDGVAIYGGFQGDEVLRDQRDPDPFTNGTVLSGDQWRNGTGGANDLDNSFHVVVCDGVGDGTVLDGFTITGGLASLDTTSAENKGGGIWMRSGRPTFRNLWIVGNQGRFGGGMAIGGTVEPAGSTTLERVTFDDNSAVFGGGLDNEYGEVTLSDVDFVGNQGSFQGGAVRTLGQAMLNRVRFLGNSGGYGGALYVTGQITIHHAVFAGNEARYGGAVCIRPSSLLVLHHGSLSGNHASTAGGAIWSGGQPPRLYHSILWGNTAPAGPEIHDVTLDPDSAYNIVQGGDPTGSNIWTNDPRFVRNPTEDDVGNLRLRVGSPAIDAGETNRIPAGVSTDLVGNPRVTGNTVDLGAYEGGFVTFDDLYPHLTPEDDTNEDGLANLLPYLFGRDPEGAGALESKPRLIRDNEHWYLEYQIRATAGDYHLVFDSSNALPDWFPLNGLSADYMVPGRVTPLADGVELRRVRLLIDPSDTGQRYLHGYAQPVSP